MLKLILITRWNILVNMLERLLEIKTPIAQAIIDCGIEQTITKKEFEVLSDIVCTLQPIEVRSEKLGSRGMTLPSGKGLFAFIIDELTEQNSPFSKLMKVSFIKRISERRNKVFLGLMKYLNYGKLYNNCEGKLPALAPKTALLEAAKKC